MHTQRVWATWRSFYAGPKPEARVGKGGRNLQGRRERPISNIALRNERGWRYEEGHCGREGE